MQIGRIDVTQLRGVVDKAVGLGKELLGTLMGNDALQREGESQQERAGAELKALRKQVEAQRKESVADVYEAREKAAQQAKSA